MITLSPSLTITFAGKAILNRKPIVLTTKAGQRLECPPEINDNVLTADFSGIARYTETLSTKDSCTMSGNISLEVFTDEAFRIDCPFGMTKTDIPPYFMIPGFLYGSNNLATAGGNQPRLSYGEAHGWPVSSAFSVRADRSTHNAVITVHHNHVAMIAIDEKLEGAEPSKSPDPWLPGYYYNGLMLDTQPQNEDIIGFQLGYENYPKRYTHVWQEPPTPSMDSYRCGWIANCKGNALKTTVQYFADKAQEIPDYGKALKARYLQIHSEPLKRAGRTETMEKVSATMMRNGWNEEHKFIYLCDNDEGRLIGDNGWTGGMQDAFPLLMVANRMGNESLKTTILSYIDNLADNLINPNAGLFYEEFRDGRWQVDGWWGRRENCYNWGDKPLHSAYVNGQAAYYLLRSYIANGQQNSNWVRAPRTVIDTAIRSQRTDGAYARFFSPDSGNAVDYNGFQSCWFVCAAALLASITAEPGYRESAEKAILHYRNWHLEGELYGTPMDTHEAIDEEGNLAYIDACAELHKLTGDKKYIDLAWYGLHWEFSWKFPYNTAFTNEPLRSLNWSSSGGSITSVHNPHIHPMGNLAAGSMYYLYQQTGDEYIANRLKDTCIWGMGIFNRHDGEFGFGLEGMATEQFFHSDAILLPWWRPWDGGVWEAYLPWAPGCILLSCAEDIPNDFFGE